jgi:hypothetical protein
VADAAAAAGLSERRSYEWLKRYRAGGEIALHDRSSTPARYRELPASERDAAIERLRRRGQPTKQTPMRLAASSWRCRHGLCSPACPPSQHQSTNQLVPGLEACVWANAQCNAKPRAKPVSMTVTITAPIKCLLRSRISTSRAPPMRRVSTRKSGSFQVARRSSAPPVFRSPDRWSISASISASRGPFRGSEFWLSAAVSSRSPCSRARRLSRRLVASEQTPSPVSCLDTQLKSS